MEEKGDGQVHGCSGGVCRRGCLLQVFMCVLGGGGQVQSCSG